MSVSASTLSAFVEKSSAYSSTGQCPWFTDFTSLMTSGSAAWLNSYIHKEAGDSGP